LPPLSGAHAVECSVCHAAKAANPLMLPLETYKSDGAYDSSSTCQPAA